MRLSVTESPLRDECQPDRVPSPGALCALRHSVTPSPRCLNDTFKVTQKFYFVKKYSLLKRQMTHIKSLVFQCFRLTPRSPRSEVCGPAPGVFPDAGLSSGFLVLPFFHACHAGAPNGSPPPSAVHMDERSADPQWFPRGGLPGLREGEALPKGWTRGCPRAQPPPSHVALGDAARVSHPPTVEHKPVAPGMVPHGWLVLRRTPAPGDRGWDSPPLCRVGGAPRPTGSGSAPRCGSGCGAVAQCS